jgi:hypothetical protein
MRNRALLVCLFLLSARCADAQSPKVLGGVAVGNYASSWDMANTRLPGVVLGGGIEFGDGGLSAETDVLYIEKKSRYVSRNWDSTLAEISIPLLLKAKAGHGSGPYLLGGCEIAYILSQSQVGHGENEHWHLPTRKYDGGLVVGGGFEIERGGVALEVEGRYHLGLVATTRFSGDDYDFKTRVFVLLAGVRF